MGRDLARKIKIGSPFAGNRDLEEKTARDWGIYARINRAGEAILCATARRRANLRGLFMVLASGERGPHSD